MEGVFLTMLGLLCLVCFYLLIRNHRVLNHQLEMITRVHEAAQEDVSRGLPWSWRYDEFSEVSYNRMLLHYKPLDSFFVRDPARAEQ